LASGQSSNNKHSKIIIWDVEKKSEKLILEDGHKGAVNYLAWLPDGTHLVSAGSDNKIILWNAKTAEPIVTIKVDT